MALQRTSLSAPACTSFNSLTSSLTALASSAAIVVGSSANITDHEVQVTLTSPATYTASASTMVNLLVYGTHDGTNWTSSNNTNELIDGTDKAITVSANGNNAKWMGSVMMPLTTAGTSVIYKSPVFNIASLFGGVMPSKYVIVAQNQVGATLPASGHSISVQEIYYN